MGACTGTQRQKHDLVRDLSPICLHIVTFIWNKEAHNLFDFENHQCSKKEIELDFTATLATVEKELVALTDQVVKFKEYVKNQQDILQVEFNEDKATLKCISQKQDHRIWVIIRNSPLNSQFESLNQWELQKNDILKLGRQRLQLIDFKFYNEQNPYIPPPLEDEEDEELKSQDCEGEPIQCRVCFSKRATKKNPLMSPCFCKSMGSVRYIHLKCLQNWLLAQTKVKKGENFVQYGWKKMECEICKSALQSTYTYQDQRYWVLDIPKPTTSYMMWKVTNDEKGKEEKAKEGMIYIIEVGDKTEIKLGRIPESDIKLKDISVSRSHAYIKIEYIPGNPVPRLILSDSNSKFGTLVYAQWDWLLHFKPSIVQPRVLYQIGRVLLHIVAKQKPPAQNYWLRQSTYKHPSNLFIFRNTQKLDEKATINPNQNQDQIGSFQTHNELNLDDIVYYKPKINNFVNEENSDDEIPQEIHNDGHQKLKDS